MKKLVMSLLILASCQQKNYRYEIHKTINVDDTTANAIWYTDTIQMLGDTIYYVNSDGSSVKICPPYFVIDKTKK